MPKNSELGDIVPLSDVVDDEPEQQEEPRLSLREQLEANLEKITDESGDVEDPDEETELDEQPSESARERDEKGRFVKSANIQAQETGTEETTESEETGQAIESAPPATPVFAPSGWAAEEIPLFNQAPRELQQAIARRETDLRRGFQQASDRAAHIERTWSEVDAAFKPYEQQFDLAGVSKGQVLRQMMAWQSRLDNPDTRATAFRELARSYGTDLQQLAQYEAQQPQEPSYVRELRQQNQQLFGLFQQHQQAQQLQAHNALGEEIAAFRDEVDATGNKLRPYLEAVIDDMIPILRTLKGTGLNSKQMLQQAYEKAVWLNPQVREFEIQKRAPKVTKESVEKARRAQKLVTGEARSNSAPPPKKLSLRETLEANWDKQNPGRL